MKNLFKKSSAISIATAMLASMTLSPLASFADSQSVDLGGEFSITIDPYYGESQQYGDGVTPPSNDHAPDTTKREFKIAQVNANGSTSDLNKTAYSDDDEDAVFTGLTAGTYRITPVYTGDAASLTGINSFDVQVPMESSTGGEIKHVKVYPKDLFPEDDPNDEEKPPVVTPPVDPDDPTTDFESSVTLNKIDKTAKTPITGAKFKLYYDNDGNYMPVGNGKEYESNGADGDIVITDLPYGTYYFIETAAADGYLLEQTPVKFEITAADPHVVATKENEAEPTVSKVFDKVVGGDYYWTITAELPDNPSSLLTYTINDIKGTGLDTISIESVTSNGTTALAESDYTIVNGEISLTESGLGKLTDATSITVVVKSTLATGTALSDVTNNASIAYTYKTYVPTEDPDDITPDDIAPNDPVITPDPGANGDDTTTDDPAKPTVAVQQVKVSVVDRDDQPIDADGATFNIVDADNNVVAENVEPGDEVTLPVGEQYTLVQTKAPDGYTYSDAKVEFTVEADDPNDETDNTQIVEFTNTKNAFDLPFTGTISTIIFFAGGICLMAIAGILIFIIIKKKKEEDEEEAEQTN